MKMLFENVKQFLRGCHTMQYKFLPTNRRAITGKTVQLTQNRNFKVEAQEIQNIW